jgi:hypothetical protein
MVYMESKTLHATGGKLTTLYNWFAPMHPREKEKAAPLRGGEKLNTGWND